MSIDNSTTTEMKVFVLLAVIVGASATGLVYAPAARLWETGGSAQFRNQDVVGNYNFGYDEDHTTGGTSRRESGDAFGNKVGSYAIRDADGRRRIVSYVADAAGFRANIHTNEPGTAPKDPAATLINKGLGVAPAVAVAPAAAYAPALHYGAVAPAFHYGAALGHYGAYTNHIAAAPYYGRYWW